MSEKKKETNTRKDAAAFLKYLKNTGKVVTKGTPRRVYRLMSGNLIQ